MSEAYQIHLVGNGLSYRGVRYREPEPDDVDDAMVSAAKDAAEDMQRYLNLLPRYVLIRCLVAVTPAGVGKAEAEAARAAAMVKASEETEATLKAAKDAGANQDRLREIAQEAMAKVAMAGNAAAQEAASNALLASKEWIPLTSEQLTIKGTQRSFNSIFNAKDYLTLKQIIKGYYDSRAYEAEQIVGKALMVSVD